MSLIGIAGKAGSGKTTCSDYLVSKYSFAAISFADPIKDAVAAMFRMTRDEVEAWKISSQTVPGTRRTMREILQTLGTQWGRDMISKNIWVELTQQRILQSPLADVVISDVRFPNEITMLHQLNGSILYILGGQSESRLNGDQHLHESESFASLLKDSANHIIENTSSLEDLFARLDSIVGEMK